MALSRQEFPLTRPVVAYGNRTRGGRRRHDRRAGVILALEKVAKFRLHQHVREPGGNCRLSRQAVALPFRDFAGAAGKGYPARYKRANRIDARVFGR